MSTEQKTTETLQDVFNDSDTGTAAKGEGPFSNDEDEVSEATGEATDDASSKEADDKTGEELSGTPLENEDDLGAVVDGKGQKLIPEHRFKAALKSASERAEKAERELAERNKPAPVPVPDKVTDPIGHAQHIRMEASVEMMREMMPDYQDVIDHYATLAADNPLLDQAVDSAKLPAKLAYDIAKEDLRLKELRKLADSDELKEFREWKKTKSATPPADESLNKKVATGLRAVPNLNRSTNASPNRNVRKASDTGSTDGLWDDYKL